MKNLENVMVRLMDGGTFFIQDAEVTRLIDALVIHGDDGFVRRVNMDAVAYHDVWPSGVKNLDD